MAPFANERTRLIVSSSTRSNSLRSAAASGAHSGDVGATVSIGSSGTPPLMARPSFGNGSTGTGGTGSFDRYVVRRPISGAQNTWKSVGSLSSRNIVSAVSSGTRATDPASACPTRTWGWLRGQRDLEAGIKTDRPGDPPAVAIERGKGKEQPVAPQNGERAAAVVIPSLTRLPGPVPASATAQRASSDEQTTRRANTLLSLTSALNFGRALPAPS